MMNLKRYVIVYCLTMLAGIVAHLILARLGLNIPGTGTAFVSVISAAFYEGQAYGKAHKAKPDNRAAWLFSLQATLFSLLPHGMALCAIIWRQPDTLELLLVFETELLISIVALALLASVMTNRLFLSLGAKQTLKIMAKS